jgi:metal-responsive CopG/Arc/MetJ family transcriptional regulator
MMTCYDDAMRTIIDLPDEQIRGLAELCAREKISRAEAIRRAVDALIEDRARCRAERKAALEASFGSWKHLGIDTDTYLAEIRAEWDR